MDAWDASGFQRLENEGVTHIMTMPWLFYHGETGDIGLKIDGIQRFAADNF
jgi:hypothetical protein